MKQIRWLGHAGFKISISDPVEKEQMRNIYIDTWLQNPLIPEDLKDGVVPNDADLVLVTHGHFDHSGSAPDLVKASKNPNCKIVCNFEVGNYFQKVHGINENNVVPMNKGGLVDLGFCSVQMVSADHSSGCMTDHGLVYGGEPAGFVINAFDVSIYHAGDTNVFGDMDIINQLYKPTHALIPIGGHFTMGPKEAGYAIARYLQSVKVVIPMHFGTFPLLKGTVEEFQGFLETYTPEFKRDAVQVIDPNTFKACLTELP